MASSSIPQSCNFEVFLSFRGEDTRKTFVDHLYTALVDRKIPTYKDDETLPRGESIRPSLFKAIKGSQIAVVIFSKNYADSSWCLDELAYIMRCRDKRGLIVIPVFYDVVPSEVRKQEGDFGGGFAKQEVENINKVEAWRKALVDASQLSGWEPKNIANGHESKVIKEIADTISEKLFSINNSGIDEDLVGMSAPLQELEEQLDIGSHGVRMVGIWGVGGSGKTTLASSLYMKISCHFQGHCIVDNIREKSSKDGLETLQEKILSRLSNTQMKLQSVEEGKHMIRSRLSHSNVLIILDDVDDFTQLDALAGSHNWFGSGSRIIITTRDEHLLITHKVNLVFPIRLLSDEEAIQLFNKRAYNEKTPLKDYDTLSLRVVSYAARLPLALKVLGSFLYDKDDKEWRSTLDRLQDTPQTQILEQLKISYDGLESVEKEIFLDIACFSRRRATNDVMEILEACGYHPSIGTRVLRQKALITIVDDRFDMHDLIREMGHYIVRMEHPHDLKKHSRVWKREEIKNMCLSDATMENVKIEAIGCSFYWCDHSSLFCEIVSNMTKLRYLHVTLLDDDYKNAKGPKFLSNELRYIEWDNYPRSPFPDTFKAMKLVVLKLYVSLQEKLWKSYKHLPHLKVLQLVSMENLLTTPDFDGLPSLQKLTLDSCRRLEKIHPSLGKHTSLEHICVRECRNLKMFPTIIHIRKLKSLEIISCHESLKFPEIKSNMDNLGKLLLIKIGIDNLLQSVGERCTNLISLRLYSCFYLTSIEVSFDGLKQLEEFQLSGLQPYSKMADHIRSSWLITKVVCVGVRDKRLSYARRFPFVSLQLPCNLRKLNLGSMWLKDGEIPSGIGEMLNLEVLNLSKNAITRLDFTVSQLTRLKILDISGTLLVEFPKLPSSLVVLKADDLGRSLATIRDYYTNCKWLCDISLTAMRNTDDCGKLLEFMLQGNAIENHPMILSLEGVEIAKGFIPPLIGGSRFRLKLPQNWCNDFSGFLICAVMKNGDFLDYVIMEQVKSGMESEDDVVWEESDGDRSARVWYVPFASLRDTTWWNSVDKAVSISFKPGRGICGGFGVRMVVRKSRSGPTTQEEAEFSRYQPRIHIHNDSQHLLEILNVVYY